MTLIQEAKLAEQIGDAFTKYREPNPEHAQDINATISELNGLSWALREIDNLLAEDDGVVVLIESDLKLVHESIAFTLDDVWTVIGSIGNGKAVLYPEDFRDNWKQITRHCLQMGRLRLSSRLDTYKRFVLALCSTLKRRPPARREFEELRHGVRALKAPEPGRGLLQDRPEAAQNAIVPNQKVLKQRSYERHRDAPLSPTDSSDSRGQFPNPLQGNLSPPMSPATTTATSVSHTSSADPDPGEHWAQLAFKEMSATPLFISPDFCGLHRVENPTEDLPSKRYLEAIKLSFADDLMVSLHYKPKDMRAKMMVQWPKSRDHMEAVCLPLDKLEIYRSHGFLRFCRLTPDRRAHAAWVSVQFSTIERLIIMACTFISMRSHAGKGPDNPIWDDEFGDEVEEFRAKINDSGYRHTLRVYRDKPSRSLRLQASVVGGPVDGTPVWTAFIHYQVTSPTWCQQIDRRTVFLKDLRLHMFSSKYVAERDPSGAYVLVFESSTDTRNFITTIDRLGKLARRNRLG